MAIFDRVTLTGRYIRLEPLSEAHKEGLSQAVCDGELWNLIVTKVPKVEEVDAFIQSANRDHQAGLGLPFATIDIASNRVVGSTRFMKADLANRRVEIGHTFIAKSFQKTKVNTEAKGLMLTHAFETLGLNRVEFLTDFFNTASRNAILRLGAKQEGILRNHIVMPNGRVRDSVLFSIIANEWPGVKELLQHKLA